MIWELLSHFFYIFDVYESMKLSVETKFTSSFILFEFEKRRDTLVEKHEKMKFLID